MPENVKSCWHFEQMDIKICTTKRVSLLFYSTLLTVLCCSYADVRSQKRKDLGIMEEDEAARLGIDTAPSTVPKLSRCPSVGSVTSGSQSDSNGIQ